jgi:hypothetical protein
MSCVEVQKPQKRSSVKTLAGDRLAETWVQAAIAAECDPFMQQESLSRDGLAGEWLLVTSKAGLNNALYPGALPEDLLDEVFMVLARLGRVKHDPVLKPWHGNVLPDDSSPRALALRMKLARDSLALDRPVSMGTAASIRKQANPWKQGMSPSHLPLTRCCLSCARIMPSQKSGRC